MSTSVIKAAVIGLGAMGRHHVRVLSELPGVNLVAVADVSDDAVKRTVNGRTLAGFVDYRRLLDEARPDLCVVAVPTSLHYEVVVEIVSRGIHTMVEKPIASTVEEARAMMAAAASAGAALMVGHIERFNPAVVALKERIAAAGTVFQVSARRVGPFPDRIRDVGVVVDLASHDIDAMRFLLDSPVELAFAQTAQRIHTAHEDMICGILRFQSGVIGQLDVNWLTPTKIRELTVSGSHGTFVANYLTQDLSFFANSATASDWEELGNIRGMNEGDATRFSIMRREPLRVELESFVRFIQDGGTCPASPENATETLAVALALLRSSNELVPVWPYPPSR